MGRLVLFIGLIPGWLPPLRAASQDPAFLTIKVLEGDGAIYAPGSRATKGITVQITGETGLPVEGATVSFRLPEDGPGGVFLTGAKTEIATTRADGTASVWGMRWNGLAGAFGVRIMAAKGEARAGSVCTIYLEAGQQSEEVRASRPGHKWVWIAVAGAAAAVGSGVALGAKSSGSSSPAVVTGVVKIGAPTIAKGPP